MEFKKIRTRYAPSPTGLFHIGGARTALFNYLFAKHFGGDFIVRIEDTDVVRNSEDGINSQLDNLIWLSLFPDESPSNPGEYGPYLQSEKLDVYKKEANRLVRENKAYYCFCSKEELKKDREEKLNKRETPKYSGACANLSQDEIKEKLEKNKNPVIRIRIPSDVNKFQWNDLVRGLIEVPTSSMSDIVILKSDGYPTYNFAVVIDDCQMKISHVLRGEEHISNTPYQLAIKKQLGFDNEILYGHLSIIVGEDGKKLSKRDANIGQFIDDYRVAGYLPQALTNFFVLLGWTPQGNNEILSLDEMISQFDYKFLNKNPAFFDVKKLEWISSEYIKKMSDHAYISFVETYLSDQIKSNIDVKDDMLLLFKNQLYYGSQINKFIKENFSEKLIRNNLSEKIITFLKTDKHLDVLNIFLREIDNVKEWNEESIKNIINRIGKTLILTGKNLYMPIRIALTNSEHGPEIDKIIYVLGKEKCKLHIKELLSFLKQT